MSIKRYDLQYDECNNTWMGEDSEGDYVKHQDVLDLIGTHDWCCGCGHWNGCNLKRCAMCRRKPNGEM